MAVQYKNTISGMVVTTDGPDETYERHPRWRRVEGAAAEAVAAPVVSAAAEATAPARNASREAWQEYAIARGMRPEEARACTRNELRELYS